jgi:hypothetical protein
VWDKMLALIENVHFALATVEQKLVSDFPPMLWERISTGMISQVDTFKKQITGDGSG